jgi:hypothetical protein
VAEEHGSFLVEDFLEAITSQLDRTQDALALKAVNRPLTYAVRDFSLDLKVFVEMDRQGNIRFRPAGSNEEGASTVRIEFTTITRPMIEENTVSLEVTRSPTLEELGLSGDERRQLERFGVRNAEQLRRLQSTTGDTAVSRLARIPVQRLRDALRLGRPRVDRVEPVPRDDTIRPDAVKPDVVRPRPPRLQTPPLRPHRRITGVERPPSNQPRGPRVVPRRPHAARDDLVEPRPERPLKPMTAPVETPAVEAPPVDLPAAQRPRADRRPDELRAAVIRAAPDSERLRLAGRHLLGPQGPPQVRLGNRLLEIVAADDEQIEVLLPPDAGPGPLDVELPNGEVLELELAFDHPELARRPADAEGRPDPWAPWQGGS